ncbi:MAG: tetratricopeptide repeat protein [Planctomycetaceae bacterium]|nr:tetratricopeptide repeat protein [Planctomycetaceae bacterium]
MPSATHDPLLQRARSLTRERKYLEAIGIFQEILETDPDSVEGREGLAMAYFISGEFAPAVENFEKLTFLQPTEARHYVNWGAVLNRTGKHKEAADILRRAIQRNRKSADAYYNLGIAQRHLKQPSMAVSAYKEAIRLDPQMAEAYQNLGNVYLEIGSHQLAISSFQKALEVRPDFEKARVGLTRAEDAVEKARASRNPFGRLVESQAQKSATQVTFDRELSNAERHEDRQQVSALALEIKTLGDACAATLHDQVERRLHAMTRVAAESAESPTALIVAAEEFRNALQQWMSLRQQMRRRILELRGHEELMNTPDLRTGTNG